MCSPCSTTHLGTRAVNHQTSARNQNPGIARLWKLCCWAKLPVWVGQHVNMLLLCAQSCRSLQCSGVLAHVGACRIIQWDFHSSREIPKGNTHQTKRNRERMFFGKVNQCQIDFPVHTASFLQKSTLLDFWKLTGTIQQEWKLFLKLIP